MSNLKAKIDYIFSERIRPRIYRALARTLPGDALNRLLNLFYANGDRIDVERIEHNASRFLFDTADRPAFIKTIKEHFPDFLMGWKPRGDQVTAGNFDLLGSGLVRLGTEFDWHRDFKSGYSWPRDLYCDLSLVRMEDTSDVKVPWELSRCQHFNDLGLAYWVSGHECYAQAFVRDLNRWIDENPPRIGVNWACGMEIAIRLLNWISGYYYFREAACFTRKMKTRFFSSIRIQLIHIYHNLELGFVLKDGSGYRFINGNHFLANLLGLVVPGIVFPELLPDRIFRQALRWLEIEAGNQIASDGVHHELSTGYHRLILEMLLCAAIVMRNNRMKIPTTVMLGIERMMTFVAAYMKPNGRASQIRDADDGRLFNFGRSDINDHGYLLDIGAVFLDDKDLKKRTTPSAEALWWIGPNGIEAFQNMPISPTDNHSVAFEKSGFFFLRQSNDYLAAICAETGMGGFGNHGHNDALSFELMAEGIPVIVDPGTYTYTAEPLWRNRFRSTAFHNTIQIDGLEINPFESGNLFSLKETAHPKCAQWQFNEEYDFVSCEHFGYHRICHKRTFFYDRTHRSWQISDALIGDGAHNIESFLHFAPEWTPDTTIAANELALRHSAGHEFRIWIESPVHWELGFKEEWVSPSYGIKKPAFSAYLMGTLRLPVKVSMKMEFKRGRI
jgi:hypothetical protein